MSALGQRLVPIRPSPQRGSSGKIVTVLSSGGTQSPETLTPPKTGFKRKYDEDSDDESETESCKRRINFAVDYVCSPHPVSISRRNARERNRVKQVNNGFAALRQHIPGAAKAKKISKVDTLKQAVEYIQNLQKLLQENDDALMKETKEYFQFHLPTSSNDSQNTQNTDCLDNLASPSVTQTSTSFQIPHFYFDENISPGSSAYGSNVMSPEPASLPMSPTVPISSPYFPLPTQQQQQQHQQQQQQQHNHQQNSSSVPPQPYTTFAATNSLFDLSLLPLSQRSGHNSSQTASLSRLAYQRHDPQLPTIPEHASLSRALEPTEPTPSSVPTQVQDSPAIPSRQHLAKLAIRTAALERSPVPDVRLPILESTVSNLFQSAIHELVGSPPSYGSPTDSTYSSTPLDSVYASPPEELTPPDITNIDSAIPSNYIPSFAHMMEAYDPAIDPTSPTVVEDGDSLDAIDLWEKC